MRNILTLVLSVLIGSWAMGQRLHEGEMQANAGLGLNSGGWGVPVYVGVDYGILPDITVGGVLSYSSQKKSGVTGTWFGIGARGDYHFNTLLEIPDIWDAYAGLTLAYNNFSYNGSSFGDNSGLGFAIQIGGRYYFNERWAANLEFGGGSIASGGKVGVSYRF